MATTNFSAGTVIASSWLNDVDDYVYSHPVFNVKSETYGAMGDGTTDDTAAIQAALDAAKLAGGGTVIFPIGVYRCTSALSLTGARGVVLQGQSASTQPTGGSILMYTGTAASFLTFNACASVYLDKLGLRYNNAGFTGSLVSFPLTAGIYVSNSSFMGSGQTGGSYCIDLNITTDVSLSNLALDFCSYGIRGQHEDTTGYANAVFLSAIRFGDGLGACIRNPGQSWSIHGCDFEVASSDKGQAIKMSDAGVVAIGLHISGSWFGDATDTSAWSWIEFRGSGLNVVGNYIHGTGAFASTGIEIKAAS